MTDTAWTVVVLLSMLTGLAGTLLPVLPGILLMWASAIAYGFMVGFSGVGIAVIAISTLLSGLAVALGFFLPKHAASSSGVSWKSQVAAVIGAVIGFFVIPVIGLIVGAIVGIGLAEYYDKRDWEQTKQSTIAVAKGFGLSAAMQFAIGVSILLIWLAWAGTVVL